MLENVSEIGVDGFYTYHFTEGTSFRPCATSIFKNKAIKSTLNEYQEIELIKNKQFPNVLFGGSSLGKFKLPIHLHPFMWQKRTIQDVEWYNQTNVQYIPFYNFRDDSVTYLPKELTVYSESKSGLTYTTQEGYSFDESFEEAKVKAVMELIEKDVVTLWWHRETNSTTVIIDDSADDELSKIRDELVNQNIDVTILDIINDLGVFVVVCILKLEDYPIITYGSAAHFSFQEATKHAIYEAISCIVGLRYEFIHFKQIQNVLEYPDFIMKNPTSSLNKYVEKLTLKEAINKYDFYYTYIMVEGGFLVKAYCYDLQATLYSDTVPLTKRFFRASLRDVNIKDNFPFL